jgi:Dolichyl-phosphate-mannose-protein mannosyltransferase
MRLRFLRSVASAHVPSIASPGVDWLIYAFVLLVGTFQLTHYTRTADFVADVTYPDLAHSILEQGAYQLRFLPQTVFPPGFPFILALVGRVSGFTPAGLFPVIAVSTALGLIFAYLLLRRVGGRGVAAVACLLFGSSPVLFVFNTTVVSPEMSYFLASMLVLFLALKIDDAGPGRVSIAWILLLSLCVVLAVLIRSVGVALVMGLGAWCATSLLISSELGWRRIKRFSVPLLFGLAAQLSWGEWAQDHQVLEWQLPGYPNSYFSQLKVKDGQHPELGEAHIGDIPRRVAQNIVTRTVSLGQVLTHRYISGFWPSPAICGVVILISIGLASSFRNAGQLHDWYFLWYELIFLFWPWDTKDRFLFPVVPLAVLYLWRGAKVLWNYSTRHPKIAGVCLVLAASFLALRSAEFAFRVTTLTTNMRHAMADRLEPVAATLFWVILAVIGAGMLAYPALRSSRMGAALAWLRRHTESNVSLPMQFVLILAIALLVEQGARQILIRGRDNLQPEITGEPMYPEIEASAWIKTHEPGDRVIMAREPEFVFHYTQRRVVWFPPISDPDVLMDGIRRHHVAVVVVAHHSPSYWLPTEEDSFQSLLRSYGTSFQLRHQGPENWIYEVVPPQDER